MAKENSEKPKIIKKSLDGLNTIKPKMEKPSKPAKKNSEKK